MPRRNPFPVRRSWKPQPSTVQGRFAALFKIAPPLIAPVSFFPLAVNLVSLDTFPDRRSTLPRPAGRFSHHDADLIRSTAKVLPTDLVVCRTVGGVDVPRHRADGGAVPLCRKHGAFLIIENRPWPTIFSHHADPRDRGDPLPAVRRGVCRGDAGQTRSSMPRR